MNTSKSDHSFNDAEFRELSERCRRFGLQLFRPRGLRKYYCLDSRHQRVHLAKTWTLAKGGIGAGVRWLFENATETTAASP
jgi:hypothetical protein